MKSNRLIIILVALALVLVAVAIIGKKKGWIGKGDVMEVAVDKVTLRSVVETVTASGKINPHTEVKLSSEVSGEVIKLPIHEGDSVKKGDLLCTINPSIYQAIVTQSEAS